MIIKSNNKGFTIVEVLIVLAIAGVILATILLAVPALQRNSRNTKVKQAATALVAGALESASANGGTAPTAISTAGEWTNTTKTTTTVSGNITIKDQAKGAPVAPFASNTVYVVFSSVCLNGNATASGASAANIAVVYTVENGTTNNSSGCMQG